MALWRGGVESAIGTMQSRLDGPLSLKDLAKSACMSRFHFDRVFRELTGIRPGQYLTAMRIAHARDMLMTTEETVSEICFSVGYNSLGTFTRRFTELVGVSPQRMRYLARRDFDRAARRALQEGSERRAGADVIVWLRGAMLPALVLVGAYDSPMLAGWPSACVVTRDTASCIRFASTGVGRKYFLALALPQEQDPSDITVHVPQLVGAAESNPVVLHAGDSLVIDIVLRPPDKVTPPIVSCLPLLFRAFGS
jgi:AraC family transcriptional regulator